MSPQTLQKNIPRIAPPFSIKYFSFTKYDFQKCNIHGYLQTQGKVPWYVIFLGTSEEEEYIWIFKNHHNLWGKTNKF